MTVVETFDDKIWLKHGEEDDKTYSFFATYFLSEKDPSARTVMGAYRRYLKKGKGASDTYIAGVSSVPAIYLSAAKGLDKAGNLVVPKTWQERADAYWLWIIQDEMNQALERRKRLTEDEYNQGMAMLGIWETLFHHFVRYMNSEISSTKKTKTALDTSTLMRKFRDMINSRNELAEFLRRSLGMTIIVKEDVIEKSVGEKKIEIEWTKPEGTKYEETSEDIELKALSEEEFAALVERLSTH